jgi:hypothetical protein
MPCDYSCHRADDDWKEGLVAIHFILGFLFVLGLVTAWCSQLGEGVLITATSSIRQAIDGQEQKPKIEQVRETVGNLESNLWLWKATLYAGIAVVGCSLIGFSVLPKARSSGE